MSSEGHDVSICLVAQSKGCGSSAVLGEADHAHVTADVQIAHSGTPGRRSLLEGIRDLEPGGMSCPGKLSAHSRSI